MNKALNRVSKQRDIIDRKVLFSRIEEIAAWSGIKNHNRQEVLNIFKQTLSDGNNEIQRRFEKEHVKGTDTVRAQAFLIDQLVRVLYDIIITYVYPVANPTKGEQIAIVATGGYGRGALAPFSDVDLMFLLKHTTNITIELGRKDLRMITLIGIKLPLSP